MCFIKVKRVANQNILYKKNIFLLSWGYLILVLQFFSS